MAEETTQTTEVETVETETPVVASERTFTQDEVNALIGRAKKDAADKAKADAEEKAKKAQMGELERATTERAEAEQRATEAETRARLAGYRADLKGEVVDVDAALRLVDDEKHVKDGSVDVKALLKQYPFLAPTRSTAPGAGGVQGAPAGDPASSLSAAMAADGIKFG